MYGFDFSCSGQATGVCYGPEAVIGLANLSELESVARVPLADVADM